MAKQNNISPSDKDFLLAERIGYVLPNISSLKSEEDAFLNALLGYKESYSTEVSLLDSNELWEKIQPQTIQKVTPIYRIANSFNKYAAAAIVLLATLFAQYIYQNSNSEILIAESFASMERVILKDGSVVTLRPNSALYENSYADNAQSYKLEGEAYFEVISNSQRTFKVDNESAQVSVLGTKFTLSDWGNRSTVFLEEGKIEYTNKVSKEKVVLLPGELSVIEGSSISTERSAADVHTDWLSDELIFDNNSILLIFEEIEQHYGISISSNSDLNSETLSGTIKIGELSDVLNDLETVLNGTFSENINSKTFTFSFNN